VRETYSSNAFGSERGWEFQFAAAIHIFLSFVEDVLTIKIEGAEEDIELTLNNNHLIYSQAKCVSDIEDHSNVKSNFEKAIRTLSKAGSGKAISKLIYITNTNNPFGITKTMQFFYGTQKHKFSELPLSCKQKVEDYVSSAGIKIEKEYLEIWILPFFGEEKNRYAALLIEINNFLATIPNTIGLGELLLTIWVERFSINAGNKYPSIKIKKEDVIWPIIALTSDRISVEEEISRYDPATRDEIYRQFKHFIHDKSNTFSFSNRVINSFNDFCSDNKLSVSEAKSHDCFISSKRHQFDLDFDIDYQSNEFKEILMELVIRRILRLRYLIFDVKRRVGL